MDLPNEQLIAEAIEVNHPNIGEKTRERYEDHLIHYSQYLATAHGKRSTPPSANTSAFS